MAEAIHLVTDEPLARLDQGDFDLFVPLLRSAHASAQTVQRARQELAQIEANHKATARAVVYIMKQLAPKYQMGEGDDINADGVIIRQGKVNA